MPNCEVRACPNFKFRRNENNVNVRFHKFPTNDEYRLKWEEWVAKVNGTPVSDTEHKLFLCSNHFDRGCYMPSMCLRRKAVPSIEPQATLITQSFKSAVENHTCQSAEPLGDVSNVPSFSNLFQTTAVSEGEESGGASSDSATSSGRKTYRMAYIGDITLEDLTSPERAERSLILIKQQYKEMQDRNAALARSLRKMRKKILLLQEKMKQSEFRKAEIKNLNKVNAKLNQGTAEKEACLAMEVSGSDSQAGVESSPLSEV